MDIKELEKKDAGELARIGGTSTLDSVVKRSAMITAPVDRPTQAAKDLWWSGPSRPSTARTE